MKRIGFVGYECEDIVIHFGKLLTRLGFRTVIVDQSKALSVFGLLGVEKEEDDQMLRHYMGELIITAKQGDSFTADYLLTHYEYPGQAALRKDNEIMLFCTDEIICHAKQLRLPINENCIKWLLVKNGIDTKYDSTYLAHLSGHQPEWTYYLPYHEKDAIRRCYLGTDRHYRLKDLSELMRKLLLELAVRTTEIDVKRIKAAIKEG